MNRTVSVSEIFDTNPFSSYQVWVCSLSFCIMFLEGFDMMIIGVALPKIADFLHSKPSALGLALSAGQVVPLAGAVGLGMVADRWGRKRTLFLSAIVFGIFTLMTAYITSVQELALLRFLAGIGLGGAIPMPLLSDVNTRRAGCAQPLPRPCTRVWPSVLRPPGFRPRT